LAKVDAGPDLVLYFKHMMTLRGNPEYALHFNPTDGLSPSRRGWTETQRRLTGAP
jgi:4-hydroxy-tetrahydrodipicolinate synthase